MKKRYPDKNNVLLVNITRLGDMLQATPTIAGIKLENPSAKITVLVEKQFAAVCSCIPNIDEIVSLDLAMTCRLLAQEQEGIIEAYEYVDQVVDDLRGKGFDYCLNMSSSAYTALLLKLVGIKRNGGWTSDDEGYRVIESEWARLFATSVFHQNRQFNSLNLVDVFRCSADVDAHPHKLLINIADEDLEYADRLIAEAGFTNQGPIICLQAGASQEKRQWATERFVKLAHILVNQLNARLILTGSAKEGAIIDPIIAGVADRNVVSFAGRTSVPQLSAVLKRAKILVTGDTGPMHMAVAVGTPVVSMFLASAYGFETGPYSEGNILLQPIIGCGPCNPNKPCSRPDCHDQIDPELVATLTSMRLKEDIRKLPEGLSDANRVTVYRSYFDKWGFLDFENIGGKNSDLYQGYRSAYRKMWLDDLGGFSEKGIDTEKSRLTPLKIVDDGLEGLGEVIRAAEQGQKLITQLKDGICNASTSPKKLGEINAQITALDRRIEEHGFNSTPLGPLTRMFVFARENLSGTEAMNLASQMGEVYQDLGRRAIKLGHYLAT
jgi:ADP-heptose:LPS heptosyltransferase